MIINMLNEQPKDCAQAMKLWYITQFNTGLGNNAAALDEKFLKGFDLNSLENWQNSEEFKQKVKFIQKNIKKSKIDELRNEIKELMMLKQDLKNIDHKKVQLTQDYI